MLLYHVSFRSTEINGNLPNSIFDNTNSCWGEVQERTFIARYLTWTFIALLLLLEVFQFLSNVLSGNWREYFSKQNFCEIAMLCLTIAFLVIEWQVKTAEIGDQIENALKNAKGRASYQEMLLGKPFQHWRIISIIYFIKIWSSQLQNFFPFCSQKTNMTHWTKKQISC